MILRVSNIKDVNEKAQVVSTITDNFNGRTFEDPNYQGEGDSVVSAVVKDRDEIRGLDIILNDLGFTVEWQGGTWSFAGNVTKRFLTELCQDRPQDFAVFSGVLGEMRASFGRVCVAEVLTVEQLDMITFEVEEGKGR